MGSSSKVVVYQDEEFPCPNYDAGEYKKKHVFFNIFVTLNTYNITERGVGAGAAS